MPIEMRDGFHFYSSLIKPIVDFACALILLLLLLPLLLIISLLLFLTYWGSPFYVQNRIGKGGLTFALLKFRTFQDDDSKSRIGRFLRITSLDELPQLVNIVKGEMSFVGPRPLLQEYLPFYNQFESRRHDVKPGLTGLAQIRIGNSDDWEKRMQYDVRYVETVSFLSDAGLLLETAWKIWNFRKRKQQDVPIEKFSDFASRREVTKDS